MSKDNFKGEIRSTIGQAEQVAGEALQDKSIAAQGRYDEATGKVQSAVGSVKDAVSSGADAVAVGDFSALRDEMAKLTHTISGLVQKHASSTRDQVMDAVGSAGENISQSASGAQDKLISLEVEIGSSIKKNPWTAVAIAALLGLLIGKLT